MLRVSRLKVETFSDLSDVSNQLSVRETIILMELPRLRISSSLVFLAILLIGYARSVTNELANSKNLQQSARPSTGYVRQCLIHQR